MNLPPARPLALLALLLGSLPLSAPAQSAAEDEARQFVAKVLAARPATGFTNHGVMKLRDPQHGSTTLPLTCQTVLSDHDWTVTYQAGGTALTVTHPDTGPNRYSLRTPDGQTKILSGRETALPFAGSDFQLGDLGLEFLHWPGQRVVKKEFHRNCSCTVIESANPFPGGGTYARVVAWFDEESLGIVEAEAYDAAGNEVKNFYPKDLKKVNGVYQVETLFIKNPQTGSRTQLEFNFEEPPAAASPEK